MDERQPVLKYKRTLWFGREYDQAMGAAKHTPLSGHAFIRECIRIAIPSVLKKYGVEYNKEQEADDGNE